MSSLMPRLDLVTRAFWRATGRPVDLWGNEQWLAAPTHDGPRIADGWLSAAAAAYGGTVREGETNGLLADMSELDDPDFRAADLLPCLETSGVHLDRSRPPRRIVPLSHYRAEGLATSLRK